MCTHLTLLNCGTVAIGSSYMRHTCVHDADLVLDFQECAFMDVVIEALRETSTQPEREREVSRATCDQNGQQHETQSPHRAHPN